jgi:hypothetical protein
MRRLGSRRLAGKVHFTPLAGKDHIVCRREAPMECEVLGIIANPRWTRLTDYAAVSTRSSALSNIGLTKRVLTVFLHRPPPRLSDEIAAAGEWVDLP